MGTVTGVSDFHTTLRSEFRGSQWGDWANFNRLAVHGVQGLCRSFSTRGACLVVSLCRYWIARPDAARGWGVVPETNLRMLGWSDLGAVFDPVTSRTCRVCVRDNLGRLPQLTGLPLRNTLSAGAISNTSATFQHYLPFHFYNFRTAPGWRLLVLRARYSGEATVFPFVKCQPLWDAAVLFFVALGCRPSGGPRHRRIVQWAAAEVRRESLVAACVVRG